MIRSRKRSDNTRNSLKVEFVFTMGNAGSTNSNAGGNLSLVVHPPSHNSRNQAHQGFYLAGTKVTGVVYAANRAQEKLAKNNKASLNIYLAGKENVMVKYTETETYYSGGESHTRTVTRTAYAQREVVRIVLPVTSNYSSLEPGKYEFPFEFTLPQYCPTSMYHSGHGGYCQIVYKIKAQLDGGLFGGFKQEFVLPVKATPMPITPVPYNVEPLTKNVKFCCCFDRGTIMFGAAVPDTRIGRGEQIDISFSCKNQSTAEIQYVSASLQQSVYWSARGHSSNSNHALVSQTFRKTDDMEKLNKDEMKTKKHDDENTKQRALNTDYEEIFKAIQNRLNVVTLTVPQTAYHSYKGGCCTVSHYLKIFIKTSGGVTNPEVTIPIQIGTLSDENFESVESLPEPSAPPLPSAPPADWGKSDVVASPVFAPATHQVYVGSVVQSANETDLDSPQPSAPMFEPDPNPSLNSLINELKVSISASSTVRERIQQRDWKNQVFASMTPSDFVSLIRSVNIEFDQAEVAGEVASVIDNFGCQYIVAVIRSVSEWIRVTMVQRLLPHAKDLKLNYKSILEELSEWEKLSTRRDFDSLLE